MRKLRLILVVAFSVIFMMNEPCFAQARRGGEGTFSTKEKGLEKPDGRGRINGKKSAGPHSPVMEPLKAMNFKAELEKLQQQGWQTEKYTLEDQLTSSWRVMLEMDTVTFKPIFVWALSESRDGNLKKAQTKNFESCIQNIESQLMEPVFSECSKFVAANKNIPSEKLEYYMSLIEKSASTILRRTCQKSMEINKVEGKYTCVRTMMVTSKLGFYKMLPKEVSMQVKNDDDGRTCNELLNNVYKKMQIEMKK